LIKNWISGASITAIALAHLVSGALAADKPVYAVLMKTLSNQFFIAAAKGIDEGAKEAEVDIILAAGETGQMEGRRRSRLSHRFGQRSGRRDGKDANGPVLVIEGLSGDVTSQKRALGFVAELKKQAPGLDVVASLPGDWDSLKAADIANDTLQRNPDLSAIFCANDDMALGAVEAARSAGKDKVIVIGVDGTQSALKSIRAGRLNASVAQLPYLMGIRAIEDTKRALAGEKVPEFVDVPTLVLTRDAIEANKELMLQYVK